MQKKCRLFVDVLLWVALLSAFMLHFTGCSSLTQTESEEASVENASQDYMVDWVPLEPIPSTKAGPYLQPVIVNQAIYYVNQNADTNSEDYTLYWQNLSNDETGNAALELAERFTLSSFAVDVEGNRYFCINDASSLQENPNAKARKLLIKQDASGKEIYRVEVPQEHCGLMPAIHVDVQGKIYFTRTKDYVIYNQKGEYEGTILWEAWEKVAAEAEGKEYSQPDILWENYNILSETVKSATVWQDGRVAVIVGNYDKDCYELAVFTPVTSEQTADKTVNNKIELTLGILTCNSLVREAVVEFNKSQNEIQVLIREYRPEGSSLTEDEAISVMYNDMQAGKGPDILAVSPGMDWYRLAAAGTLEDLYPYVEKSSVIQEDSYLKSAWAMYLSEGKLLAIPTDFTIQTLVGKSELLGEKESLTVAELMSIAENYPGSRLLENNSKESIFNLCFACGESGYVDMENRTCDFMTDDFYKVMEFVYQFPEDGEATVIEDADRFSADKVLLQEVELINADSYLQVFEDFGMEAVTFIGYPISEEGAGHIINPCGEVFCISALSGQKEEAWKFIEAYDLWNQERVKTVGFSAKKEILEAQLTDALQERSANTNSLQEHKGYEDFTEKQLIEQFTSFVDNANSDSGWNPEIVTIFMEESMPFLVGDKSAQEVAEIIQNRVTTYLAE